jgi:formylglycine-generating enzyme required for sulfatase activity
MQHVKPSAILKGAIVALTVLLLAEAAARLSTHWAWREPVRENEWLRRLLGGGKGGALLEATDLVGPVERRRVQVYDPVTRTPKAAIAYGSLPPTAFPDSPLAPARPGALRVACLGDSVVFDGLGAELQAQADGRYGAGRVEVRNFAVPGGTYAGAMVIARNYLAAWPPHVVVAYSGRNDLLSGILRQRVERREMLRQPPLPMADYLLAPGSRGIWALLTEGSDRTDPPPPGRAAQWEEGTSLLAPVDELWRLSRAAWLMDATLAVATYATPDPAWSSVSRTTASDLEIRYLFAVLGDQRAFHRRITALNGEVRRFAQASGATLVDVAGALKSEAMFTDIVHETAAGQRRHAEVTLDALDGEIRRRLGQGVAEPGRRWPVAGASASAVELPAVPPDGTCRRGPCGEGECYVPPVAGRTGYERTELAASLERASAAYGYDRLWDWYSDDAPSTPAEVSAFCLDRTEMSAARQQACIAAGACPPVRAPLLTEDGPAVVPTRLDAEALCAFDGKRLPTDMEWEMAARGPEGRLLPWGDTWTGREANACGAECPWAAPGSADDGLDGPAAPGRFPGAGPYGHVDLAGNQWEWVQDCFRNGLHSRGQGGRDVIAAPEPGCRWIIRGGSWRSLPGFLEKRVPEGAPDTEAPTRGVRCARDFGTKHRALPGEGVPPAPVRGDIWRL